MVRFWLYIFAALTFISGFSSLTIAEETTPEKPQTTAPSQPTAALVTEEKKDPCEAHSYEYYVMCRDRMRKIQAMLDARDQRDNKTKPKAAPEKTAPPDASKNK